jgi:hypothetical protein
MSAGSVKRSGMGVGCLCVAGGAELGACGGGYAPGHAGGIVGDADVAGGAEEDDAAVAAEAGEEVVDGGGGCLLGGCAGGDAVDGPLAEDELHDGFAPAGEGDGGGLVVGVAAAPDEGAVGDAAGGLAEGASGGGAGGEVAVLVEGNGAYGVVRVEGGVVDAELVGEGVGEFGFEGGLRFTGVRGNPRLRCETWGTRIRGGSGEGGVGVAGGFGALEGHEAVALAGDDEVGVFDEAHAVLGGEALGARADKVDVGRLLEDEASGLDGVAEVLDAGDAAGAEVGAVHEEGVELDAAVAGEEGAAAGVKGVVVFHAGDGGLDGVDSGAAAGESGPAGGEGCGDAALVGGDGVVRHGPCAAMDEEDGFHPVGSAASLRRSVSR